MLNNWNFLSQPKGFFSPDWLRMFPLMHVYMLQFLTCDLLWPEAFPLLWFHHYPYYGKAIRLPTGRETLESIKGQKNLNWNENLKKKKTSAHLIGNVYDHWWKWKPKLMTEKNWLPAFWSRGGADIKGIIVTPPPNTHLKYIRQAPKGRNSTPDLFTPKHTQRHTPLIPNATRPDLFLRPLTFLQRRRGNGFFPFTFLARCRFSLLFCRLFLYPQVCQPKQNVLSQHVSPSPCFCPALHLHSHCTWGGVHVKACKCALHILRHTDNVNWYAHLCIGKCIIADT